MKSLKLNHVIAKRIANGEITSTIRLYDDKDLSVNDQVSLLDKIDPKSPATWRQIGVARIVTVIQKRLGDITEAERLEVGLEPVKTSILASLQEYYGGQVTMDTPVKIIRFILDNTNNNEEYSDVTKTSLLKEINVYADGGSRGNPGPSASGFVITDMQGMVVVKKSIYLGLTTNNQAEYQALKFGLGEAHRMHAREVHVYMDSLLVINQMLGVFKVKNRDLWPIHSAIQELLPVFSKVSFTHIPRELNKAADAAVNEALDDTQHRA